MKNSKQRFLFESWILFFIAGIAIVSLVGFATFGRHPEWLSSLPQENRNTALWFYSISFRLFGEGQILVLFSLFLLYLVSKTGTKWVVACLGVVGISLASEWLGTTTGVPFGGYSYTSHLGWKIAGHVPYVIPLSWFMMAVPAYWISFHRYQAKEQKIHRIAFASFLLTLWDVSLDPAMCYLAPYWKWSPAGAFYTMPYTNWIGWLLTSALIMWFLNSLAIEKWLSACSFQWMVSFYAINLFIPFGMIVVSGLYDAIFLNLLLFAFFWLWFHSFYSNKNREKAEL